MTTKHATSFLSPKKAAITWLFCVIGALFIALSMLFKFGIEQDFLTLIPEDAVHAKLEECNRQYLKSIENQMLFAVSSQAAASDLLLKLRANRHVIEATGKIEQKTKENIARFFYKYRLAFVDSDTQRRMTQNDGASQRQWVQAQVFNPFSGVSQAELLSDPLLLVRSSQKNWFPFSNIFLDQDWPSVKDSSGCIYHLLMVRLEQGSRAEDVVRSINADIKSVFEKHNDVQIFKQGIPFYVESGIQSAKHDISWLGSLSLAGLFLIFWIGFKSFRPFCLCLISISVGLIFAMAATLAVFGGIHAATLVMALSLIGISADYTTYYLTRRMTCSADEPPIVTRNILGRTLLHAVLTSSVAYAVMFFAPLPGLRQFALFGVVGLLASCLTVLLWFPFLVQGFPKFAIPCKSKILSWIRLCDHHRPRVLVAFLIVAFFCSSGIVFLRTIDNPNAMQAADAALRMNELKISSMLQTDLTQRWFVVFGENGDSLIENTHALESKLAELQAKGTITGFDSIPVQTVRVQEQLLPYYHKSVKSLQTDLKSLGITIETAAVPEVLDMDTLLASPLGAKLSQRLLRLSDGTYACILSARGISDESKMQALANELSETVWYSRKNAFETLFKECRYMVSLLFGIAFLAIFLIFSKNFGCRAGAVAALCIASALASTLGLMGWLGIPLLLFSLFALILVLGIGIDYIVFFQRHPDDFSEVAYAVSIAMTTTLMSLGILVFSSTTAISNFGLVLLIGIVVTYLFAPLVWVFRK